MSNANAQPQKEKGLFVGSQVRCFKMTTGTKQDGSMWAMFTHVEKDANKNVLQKYTLWLKNDSNWIANYPLNKTVDLKIEYIGAIRPEWKSYQNKEGKYITERLLNVDVGVEIVKVMDNNYNQQNSTYNSNQNQTYKPQQQSQQPNSFDVGGNKFANANQQAKNYQPSEEAQNFMDDIDVQDMDLPF